MLPNPRKLRRCRVRVRAPYLALGLKPIVQIVTVCPSAPFVKFVARCWICCSIGIRTVGSSDFGASVRRRLLDLLRTAIYPFSLLFSLPL